MIKHSLGEGILAPASVQVASYQARAAAIAARAANPDTSGIVKPLSVNFYLLIMNLSDQ
jgi:hypothetical protein